jgi:hypothetical protein
MRKLGYVAIVLAVLATLAGCGGSAKKAASPAPKAPNAASQYVGFYTETMWAGCDYTVTELNGVLNIKCDKLGAAYSGSILNDHISTPDTSNGTLKFTDSYTALCPAKVNCENFDNSKGDRPAGPATAIVIDYTLHVSGNNLVGSRVTVVAPTGVGQVDDVTWTRQVGSANPVAPSPSPKATDAASSYVSTYSEGASDQLVPDTRSDNYIVTESNGKLSITCARNDPCPFEFSTPDTSNGTLKFTQTFEGRVSDQDAPLRVVVTYTLHRSDEHNGLAGTLTSTVAPREYPGGVGVYPTPNSDGSYDVSWYHNDSA